jgi:hypothetical protein
MEGSAPTELGVAARITAIVSATLVFGLVAGVLVSALSGITSVKGVKKDGVLADGRVMVIKGRTLDTGVYELYISSIEKST